MLFNSVVFIVGFLPITLVGFHILGNYGGGRTARMWLLVASLVFYGWWSVGYLGLFLAWTIANFWAGRSILEARGSSPRLARAILIIAVAANLSLLAYFKYAVFISGNVASLVGIEFALTAVALPLGISFHTFQQIAYLSDVHRGDVSRYTLSDYLLFVSFFPQLIAGPIVHHAELTPQLQDERTSRLTQRNFAEGIAFFTIGLLKKLLLADNLSAIATPVFSGSEITSPILVDAWGATIAYSLGLYFDFSAYSDMAVGIARLFGVRLPYNFASPYQSASIVEFWRRWHMTLSRWLRDYLYIPLGGSRNGATRRYANLMITMLLGGLWHGASWTFVVWGGLHGLLLIINHGWDHFVLSAAAKGYRVKLPAGFGQALTLICVSAAWVFFASANWQVAWETLSGLVGANDVVSDSKLFAHIFDRRIFLIAAGIAIVLLSPNSQQLIDGRQFDPSEKQTWSKLHFAMTDGQAIFIATAFAFCLSLLGTPKEFVYFQF
jgi:alginate O-acetyltransferase complex protein AlgI